MAQMLSCACMVSLGLCPRSDAQALDGWPGLLLYPCVWCSKIWLTGEARPLQGQMLGVSTICISWGRSSRPRL